jgi:hypothetical protein
MEHSASPRVPDARSGAARRFPAISECEVVMIRLALTAAIAVAGISAAMAQGTPQERRACTRDAQRFCRQALGNDGAVQSCLQANRARLSKACSRVFASHGM